MGDRDMSRQLTSGVLGRKNLADEYIKRVISDGGIIINKQVVIDEFARLLNEDEFDSLEFCWKYGCGIKINEDGLVETLYDLSTKKNDAENLIVGENNRLIYDPELDYINTIGTYFRFDINAHNFWAKKPGSVKIEMSWNTSSSVGNFLSNGANANGIPGFLLWVGTTGGLQNRISDETTRTNHSLNREISNDGGTFDFIEFSWNGLTGSNTHKTRLNGGNIQLTTIQREFDEPQNSSVRFGSRLGSWDTVMKFKYLQLNGKELM